MSEACWRVCDTATFCRRESDREDVEGREREERKKLSLRERERVEEDESHNKLFYFCLFWNFLFTFSSLPIIIIILLYFLQWINFVFKPTSVKTMTTTSTTMTTSSRLHYLTSSALFFYSFDIQIFAPFTPLLLFFFFKKKRANPGLFFIYFRSF